jgi:endo-beta-N-acetylglucosaminidase D
MLVAAQNYCFSDGYFISEFSTGEVRPSGKKLCRGAGQGFREPL